MKGVKSKEFGCYWKSMFLSSLIYPNKIDLTRKSHVNKMKNMKIYIESMQHNLPCKFCRCFMTKVLLKKYPIDYSGRVKLMYSLYIWKDQVTKKLQRQGLSVSDSPPFQDIKKKYEQYYAKCDETKGSCV